MVSINDLSHFKIFRINLKLYIYIYIIVTNK